MSGIPKVADVRVEAHEDVRGPARIVGDPNADGQIAVAESAAERVDHCERQDLELGPAPAKLMVPCLKLCEDSLGSSAMRLAAHLAVCAGSADCVVGMSVGATGRVVRRRIC